LSGRQRHRHQRPGAIKITIRKFYRISGASTQLKGVEPDIVLPSVLNYSTQIGETSLENPLPWDTIQPVNYEKLNLVRPYLPQLQVADEARIATNQEFSYVRQDIEQFQKSQADKPRRSTNATPSRNASASPPKSHARTGTRTPVFAG